MVLDDLSSGRRENLAGAFGRGAELIEADIADPAAVAAAFDAHRPEAVFHLAAQIDVRRSVADPAYDLGVNVGGTINLLEQSRASTAPSACSSPRPGARSTARATGASSPARVGASASPTLRTASPSTRPRATSPSTRRLYGLGQRALRLGNVYGPRQDPHGEAGVVAIFAGLLLGDGDAAASSATASQTRDYVYVGDVVGRLPRRVRRRRRRDLQRRHRRRDQRARARRRDRRGLRARRSRRELAPARVGEVQRISIDSAARARPSSAGSAGRGARPSGLRRTIDSIRASVRGAHRARRRARRRSARPSPGGCRRGPRPSRADRGRERFVAASRCCRSISACGIVGQLERERVGARLDLARELVAGDVEREASRSRCASA